MNKSELIQQLAGRANLSRVEAQRAVDALFSHEDGIIAACLKGGEKVQITGFGSFEARYFEVGPSTSVSFHSALEMPAYRTIKPSSRTGLRSRKEIQTAVARARTRE